MSDASFDGNRPRVLVMSALPDWDLEPIRAAYRVAAYWSADDREALLSYCGDVRGVATTGAAGLSRAIIDRLPALEIIACYGVGTDAIDLEAARARGIAVTNTPDVLTGDVADLAVGLALAAMRRIPQADAFVREGRWSTSGFPLTRRLYGRRSGILGFGRIGAAVAARLRGFEGEIGYFARSPKPGLAARHFETPASLAGWADVLFVTVAGGPETAGMVDAQVIDALGSEGFLVNVSRGSVVDEAALLAALKTGGLAGAALDVFADEPAVNPDFLSLPNVVVQPHVASGTIETRRAMGELMRANLAAHFAGLPLITPVVVR